MENNEVKTATNRSLQRKSGAILSYIHLFLNAVISLIYVPILLRTLGNSEYGVYQLIASIVSYLSVLKSTLSATTMRFYTISLAEKDAIKSNQVLFTSKRIYQVITGLMLVLGAVLFGLITPFYRSSMNTVELLHAQQVFVVLLIQLCFEVNGCLYIAIIHSHERFVFVKLLNILTAILNPIALLLLITKYPYALTVAIVNLSMTILLYVLEKGYSQKTLGIKIQKSPFEREMLSQMVAFSGGLILAVIADQLFWKVDQIILTKFHGAAVVAVYSVAATIYMNFITLSSAVNNVFMPKITELVVRDDNNEINQLFLRIARYQYLLLFLILSGFILFGKEFVTVWVGSEYSEIFWIVLLVIIPMTPDLCEGIGLSILQARNTYTRRAYLHVGVVFTNIILTIILAKFFSGVGAAVATGLSILFGNLIALNVYYAKVERLPIGSMFVMFLKNSRIFLVLGPVGLMVNWLLPTDSVVFLILKIAFYTVCYVGAVYLWLLTAEEKQQVKNLVFHKR
ncbi:MAG: oligosaccharide flippase family protein [Clostridia bacterium]|nr:oligosaccharide flippase family protein [Clostridia bacterium]